MGNHKFVHFELSSTDAEAMKKFYGEVFGWEFMDFPEMNYTTFSTGEGELGGGFNPASENYPAGTTTMYIHTDDLEATKAKIVASGGTITVDRLEVPTVGVMAFFKDPSGNVLSALQPEMPAE